MKKSKILVPALAMLVMSTAATVTGTVAWFSANDTVNASGMTVTAKSNSSFLMIKAGSATAAEIQTAKKTEDTALNTSAALYPAAHTDAVTNKSTADTVGNWFYKTSKDPEVYGGTDKESDPTALTSFTDYVLVNEFSLTVAVGSNNMTNIKVGSCTITPASSGADAVSVLVATSEGAQEFKATDTTPADNNVLFTTLTSTTVCSVKVYIYWDGENEAVTSNNIANLKSTAVALTFTGTVA